jgi:pyruvate/2-oxoglutarate dehydrogenase complex dihydrolipoamide dehydrogenase (E3) component
MMEDIIASGQADAVVMARALLADPYLPRKAQEGRDAEIVRCCRCFTCMAERLITGLRVCALNPVIGAEYEHNFAPPPVSPKKVLIAGGGPGGMQCALTAAERGHKVILCERSDALGGALKAEAGVPFKADLYGFIATKALQMEKAGVKVLLNTVVTPELTEELSPDALIIAVGARPVIPPVAGISRAILPEDLPESMYRVKKRVVIIGGGQTGCETAVFLAGQGREVTVLELTGTLCPDANPRHRPLLLAELTRLRVKCMTGTRALEAGDNGVFFEAEDGAKNLIFADTVILAAGRRPNTETVDALRDSAPYVDMIGDCVRPLNAAAAVLRGHYAALGI